MLFHTLARSPDGDGGGGDAPTIRVTVEGKEHDVPLPKGYLPEADVTAKYVPKGAHNDQMARLRKELDGKKDLKPADDLLNDPEFKDKAVKTWGLNTATNEQFQEQLKRATETVHEREVKPREKKLAEALAEVTALRERELDGQIVAAAAAVKVDDRYLKPTTKGGKPLIVAMLRESFGFDGEHRAWFAKGANGFAYSQQDGGAPYMPVMEFMADWAAKDGKEFIRSQRQAGAEAEADGGIPGQVGKELRLTAAQIRDKSTFDRMYAKAQKEGLTIVEV